MLVDALIIVAYFVVIMLIGLRARVRREVSVEEYFLSSRALKWPSIAISTIATNIHAGHFMGMAGSAYLFGLAQANLEINAIFGILVACFIFVPLYLQQRVTTITQFFEQRLGTKVALSYSLLMVLLYASMYLGSALFWGAYAIEGLFQGLVSWIGDDARVRVAALVVALGAFSACYTYLGGLSAVVRTDLAQFVLLLLGGLLLVWTSIDELGGWAQLYRVTGDKMHLHLPASHDTLPWVALIGMNLLNLNYWGANQVILQRALAASDLRNAQLGLLIGGLLKYLMVVIIIVPGIALAGITRHSPLADPDQAYMTLVNTLLPSGLRGVILCGLFASLMSSVDSIFNSVSTLWSIDIYRRHLNPEASEAQVVRMGKLAILATLVTGLLFAAVQIHVKFTDPGFALTHWFNDLSYYVKNGFVVLVVVAVFLPHAPRRLVLATLLLTILCTLTLKLLWPEMNYFVRSMWVIIGSLAVVVAPTLARGGWRSPAGGTIRSAGPTASRLGVALGVSLVLCHVFFH
jgi:SSS family solute:Na+ symporter